MSAPSQSPYYRHPPAPIPYVVRPSTNTDEEEYVQYQRVERDGTPNPHDVLRIRKHDIAVIRSGKRLGKKRKRAVRKPGTRTRSEAARFRPRGPDGRFIRKTFRRISTASTSSNSSTSSANPTFRNPSMNSSANSSMNSISTNGSSAIGPAPSGNQSMGPTLAPNPMPPNRPPMTSSHMTFRTPEHHRRDSDLNSIPEASTKSESAPASSSIPTAHSVAQVSGPSMSANPPAVAQLPQTPNGTSTCSTQSPTPLKTVNPISPGEISVEHTITKSFADQPPNTPKNQSDGSSSVSGEEGRKLVKTTSQTIVRTGEDNPLLAEMIRKAVADVLANHQPNDNKAPPK